MDVNASHANRANFSFEMDKQTDRDTSARVELRFAAKNKNGFIQNFNKIFIHS